jgi:hypothetical protein
MLIKKSWCGWQLLTIVVVLLSLAHSNRGNNLVQVTLRDLRNQRGLELCGVQRGADKAENYQPRTIVNLRPYNNCVSYQNQTNNATWSGQAVFIRELAVSSSCTFKSVANNIQSQQAMLAVVGLNSPLVIDTILYYFFFLFLCYLLLIFIFLFVNCSFALDKDLSLSPLIQIVTSSNTTTEVYDDQFSRFSYTIGYVFLRSGSSNDFNVSISIDA